MTSTIRISPEIEATGRFLLSLSEAQEQAPNLHPERWYPLARFTTTGVDLKGLGRALAGQSSFPRTDKPFAFKDILALSCNALHDLIRGPEEGQFGYEIIDYKHVRMTCTLPLPDDVHEALFTGLGQRFLPEGSRLAVTVGHDPHGAVIDVKWD